MPGSIMDTMVIIFMVTVMVASTTVDSATDISDTTSDTISDTISDITSTTDDPSPATTDPRYGSPYGHDVLIDHLLYHKHNTLFTRVK